MVGAAGREVRLGRMIDAFGEPHLRFNARLPLAVYLPASPSR